MLAFGMPSSLSRDEVIKIATLANLELDAAEIELFARQLGDILAYADTVQGLDTSGVPPTGAIAGGAVERLDQVRPSLDRDEALGNAPDSAPEAGLFRVPRVL